MQKKCDLYLCAEVDVSQIEMLSLFDKSLLLKEGTVRSGYLSVNIDRVKLVAIVSALRRQNVPCFSAPVAYRDSKLSFETAFEIAKKSAVEQNAIVGRLDQTRSPPLFWSFSLASVSSSEKKAGGIFMVDRLDGHIWSLEEYEEYMYDYNNVF
ncbi:MULTISPECIES: hypothetical protein [unclassified Pseudomonas]|uniref:hypothetical protein n=1 Tax=Pseudomonas TaxID=286 RepID=UPI001CBC866E|nr:MULTISPECIES: hypothetical protein [unclassified Pseudomonas]